MTASAWSSLLGKRDRPPILNCRRRVRNRVSAGVVPRLRTYLDRLSRAILLLGGVFLVVTEVVGSVQVCTAGESCPPVVTPGAVVTAAFGVVLLYVSRRFQPA